MIRTKLFPRQETIGAQEEKAVIDVMNDGRLSYYRANSGESFMGGPRIQKFEDDLSAKFGTNALAVNSCTSGLHIACGAIGLQPGDEVIVTPWSMSCSATAPLIYGARPIFADIEEDYFCLDPKSIEEKITYKTKAIIVVDLFGQPFNKQIIKIAEKYGLYVIEDSAQAIGSHYSPNNDFPIMEPDEHAGTIGHIGVYSFTQGKHLTCGEGGAIVTNNSDLWQKCALIRNHAEAVINDNYGGDQRYFHKNMVGFNMRMTEIQAAIMIEQLKKLDRFVQMRQENVRKMNERLSKLSFIECAKVRDNCTHSYYVSAYKFKGKNREEYINKVKSELQGEEGRIDKGVPIGIGYITPLYKMPLFKYAAHWALKKEDISLPVVERLQANELFLTTLHGLPLSDDDIDDICSAFEKYKDIVK